VRLHALFLSWLVGAGCGQGPVVGGPPLDLSGQDPELVQAVEAVSARLAAAARGSAGALAAELELAAVLDANELDEPAEEAWGRVVALDPARAAGWYHLARVRERRGRIDGALAALERVRALEPGYAPAHLRAGRLLVESGRLEEAAAPLARALELDPTAPAVALTLARLELLRGSPEAAIARLEPLRARLPREPYVNGLLARAWSARGDAARAGTYLRAEELAGPPSVRDPWQTDVQRRAVGLRIRIERSKARLAAGDAEGAWQELEPLAGRARELPVLYAQCQVLLALGRAEEVLERLERDGQAFRESSLLTLSRVQALRALGQDARALTELEAELARNPAHPDAHALHGELLFELERHPEAVAALEAALARGADSLALVLLLARARAASGDLAGGVRELEAAARSFPHAPKPWAYRSEYLALEGRSEEARTSLEEARKRGLEPELAALVEARLAEIRGEIEAEGAEESR
jgi:predicted Zn-dependent protease